MEGAEAAGGRPRDMDPVQILADSGLFRSADRSSLEELRPLLEWVVLERDEVVPQGAIHGGDLCFLAEGRLEVSLTDTGPEGTGRNAQVVATMAPGDIVGEMQSFAGGHLAMTMRAATEVRLVRLAKEGFDHYLAVHPLIAEKLRAAVTPRFYHRQMLMVLSEMFGDLNPNMLADTERCVTWHHVPREGILFWQGESSDRVFVVIRGRLQVVAKTDGEESRVVEELTRGGAAGVGAVLTGGAQPASVFAIRDSVLIEFAGADFRELAERHPMLNKWLVGLLSRRLHSVARPADRVRRNTNIALVSASKGVRLEHMARSLCDAMETETGCLLVSSTRADSELGTPGIAMAPEGSPEDLRLQAWLDRLEEKSEYVIYLADPEATNWTLRCIRQADEILTVGGASASPRISAAEERIRLEQRSRRTRMPVALILLHPHDTDMPRDTARWLSVREVDRHFHLREGHRGDIHRIVRYVLGRELGLVLSGGGARGFAHVGVLRAMREAGLSPDILVGVSMGAIVAGRQALAGDIEHKVPGLARELTRAFTDYTLPILSLARGRRFDRCLKSLFGDAQIEDLRTPFFCVSSNLTKADTVVHRTGPMWRAIRASSGLPGLVPPVVDDGDLLYDGALMNNLPIDLVRQDIRSGPVIAVDVVPPVDLNLHAPQLHSPSGWRLALNRINPFAKTHGIPGIVSILQRTGQLPSLHTRRLRLAREVADLYLRPPVEQFRILDFSVAETAVEIGYDYGAGVIGDWVRQRREGGPVAG